MLRCRSTRAPQAGRYFTMEIEPKKWMAPIIFEGIELSPISIAIDQLGMRENLPEISEDASKWLWKFTICRGVKNTDLSVNIKKHVEETLLLVNSRREHLLKCVPKQFDGDFTDYHLNLWTSDLKIILEVCENKTRCTWTAKE